MKKIEYEEMLFARFVCSRADKWFLCLVFVEQTNIGIFI